MTTQISVIVPVYNAATTLRDAVTSILAQNIQQMELLLVDDGSTDGTASICHELSVKDHRVRVITQKNAGICAARNRGLNAASGEYVAFCDDDDILLPGALRLLLNTAQAEHADVVRGDYELLRENADGTYQKQKHSPGQICRMQKDGYAAFLKNSGPQFVWNALYRREILADVRFDERCRYGLEDFIFNMAVYGITDCAIYLPQAVYRHYEGAQSTSQCQSSKALCARVRALEPWMEAEYAAIQNRCAETEKSTVWLLRKAEAVTFLMHQLHDAGAPAALRKYAWRTLRQVLSRYPSKELDFLHIAGENRKKTAAILLYRLHMQRMYDLLSSDESTR